jgi:hypothetical protein
MIFGYFKSRKDEIASELQQRVMPPCYLTNSQAREQAPLLTDFLSLPCAFARENINNHLILKKINLVVLILYSYNSPPNSV